jgi:hypothetical protein
VPPGSAHEGPRCQYPQSHATARDIRAELNAVATNARACTSCYLDTIERMKNRPGEDHHQAIARTPRLSDGSITFFLAHSEFTPFDDPFERGQGILSEYRYAGPTDGEHRADRPHVPRGHAA